MLNANRIVSEIRAALNNHSHRTDQEYADLAIEYVKECVRANELLTKCLTYLHRGFRSEAIRLCELDPPLLDVVAQLDFPEREAWVQATERFQVETPPDLMVDAAVELNEAYSTEDHLKQSMANYRRLNLVRAPVEKRIEALQQIIQLDPFSPLWQEALRRLA